MLSNCTSNSSCPLVDLNSRQYTALNSSDGSVAQLTAGAALNSEWSLQLLAWGVLPLPHKSASA